MNTAEPASCGGSVVHLCACGSRTAGRAGYAGRPEGTGGIAAGAQRRRGGAKGAAAVRAPYPKSTRPCGPSVGLPKERKGGSASYAPCEGTSKLYGWEPFHYPTVLSSMSLTSIWSDADVQGCTVGISVSGTNMGWLSVLFLVMAEYAALKASWFWFMDTT